MAKRVIPEWEAIDERIRAFEDTLSATAPAAPHKHKQQQQQQKQQHKKEEL